MHAECSFKYLSASVRLSVHNTKNYFLLKSKQTFIKHLFSIKDMKITRRTALSMLAGAGAFIAAYKSFKCEQYTAKIDVSFINQQEKSSPTISCDPTFQLVSADIPPDVIACAKKDINKGWE